MNLTNYFGRAYSFSVLTFGKYRCTLMVGTANVPIVVSFRLSKES